jgi:hypothetical protein
MATFCKILEVREECAHNTQRHFRLMAVLHLFNLPSQARAKLERKKLLPSSSRSEGKRQTMSNAIF